MLRLRRSGEATRKRKKGVLESVKLMFFLCSWPVWVFNMMTKGNKEMFSKGGKIYFSKENLITFMFVLGKIIEQVVCKHLEKTANSQDQGMLTKRHFLIRLTCKLELSFPPHQWVPDYVREFSLSPRVARPLEQLPLASNSFLLLLQCTICSRVPNKYYLCMTFYETERNTLDTMS